MLETATWRAQNRRHFEVLEAVYGQAGVPLRTEEWNSDDDAEYAARLVHEIGSYLLITSISTAVSKNGKLSNRRSDKAWRQISSPAAGVRACVFLTLAVAGILTPEIDGRADDEEMVTSARGLVVQTFNVPDEDLQQLENVRASVIAVLNEDLTREAVERGGLRDRMAVQRGETALSYYAMQLAGIEVDELPAFERVRGLSPDRWEEERGLDWLLTFSIQLGAVWRGRAERYLEMALMRVDETVGYQIVSNALNLLSGGSWEWDEVPAVAIVKAADQLSEWREDYNLVLDCIALGYWIRRAEVELTGEWNSFDPEYEAQLREKFAAGESDEIIKIAMTQAGTNLPESFAQGSEIWAKVLDLAIPVLEERGKQILVGLPDHDDFDISRERREFSLCLGYGFAMTVDALGIAGTRPRREQSG